MKEFPMNDPQVPRLTGEAAHRIREAVTTTVLTTPEGLPDALESDPAAHLLLVSSAQEAAEQTSALLRSAVDGARSAGHSWEAIGQVLGVSRQAAQQRFASPRPAGVESGSNPPRRVIAPVTAFTEMAALEHAGRRGWHVVSSGTLHHTVEKSPWQWEHRRTVWSTGARLRRMVDDGWEVAGPLSFPWTYFKRRTDRPAEPEE